jgi:hypothetical protein
MNAWSVRRSEPGRFLSPVTLRSSRSNFDQERIGLYILLPTMKDLDSEKFSGVAAAVHCAETTYPSIQPNLYPSTDPFSRHLHGLKKPLTRVGACYWE